MDWKDRLYEEKQELSNKIQKLEDFLSEAKNVQSLANIDIYLLKAQLEHMHNYERVLSQRIHRIEESD